jgi:putative methyltransferase (TIGR04325 family)
MAEILLAASPASFYSSRLFKMSYFTGLVKDVLSDTRVGGWLGRVPFVEAVYGRNALFRTNHTALYYGIYGSYDEALAAIPPSRQVGWDNEASASIWIDDIHQLKFNPGFTQTSVYPVLFWLSRLMCEGTSLIDYGGSIGLTYYRYRRFVGLPANVRWIVVEVPKIATEGRRVAVREAALGLEFETAFDATPKCDVLLSSGALQYMERSVPGLLDLHAPKPSHVILDRIPLTTGKGYWTLQNFGHAISPYRIFNEEEFIGYFKNADYALKDRWAMTKPNCYIPFHPDKSVRQYTGLYFEQLA